MSDRFFLEPVHVELVFFWGGEGQFRSNWLLLN